MFGNSSTVGIGTESQIRKEHGSPAVAGIVGPHDAAGSVIGRPRQLCSCHAIADKGSRQGKLPCQATITRFQPNRMARCGGTKGADTVAQDAELVGGYERGRGERDNCLSDTIRIGAARAESALAGSKTAKLCAGRVHT
jgi:hypothetical protein